MNIKTRESFELISLSKVVDVFGTYYNALVKYVGTNKTEFVVAVNYDITNGSWGQGHYFSLFYDDAKDEDKIRQAEKEAKELFAERYV